MGEGCPPASIESKRASLQTDPWPRHNFFLQHYSKKTHILPHRATPPKNHTSPQVCLDAGDELIRRTNSITANNTCSRAGPQKKKEKALMNDLFTYLASRGAECRPGPPKRLFIMRPCDQAHTGNEVFDCLAKTCPTVCEVEFSRCGAATGRWGTHLRVFPLLIMNPWSETLAAAAFYNQRISRSRDFLSARSG